jgi:predicted nucleic acid-binding protein
VTTWTVDASVAAKWVLREQLSENALTLLDPSNQLLAPDLLLAEVANVLWKKVRAGDLTGEMALERYAALLDMGVTVVASAALSRRGLQVAIETGRTAYDALYLALAEKHECRLVTADERLVNSLRSTSWSERVVWLAKVG